MSKVLNRQIGNTKAISAEGRRVTTGAVLAPVKIVVERSLAKLISNTQQAESEDYEGYTKAQFMTALKNASAKVAPGRKMSREESIKSVVEAHSDALKAMRD